MVSRGCAARWWQGRGNERVERRRMWEEDVDASVRGLPTTIACDGRESEAR